MLVIDGVVLSEQVAEIIHRYLSRPLGVYSRPKRDRPQHTDTQAVLSFVVRDKMLDEVERYVAKRNDADV